MLFTLAQKNLKGNFRNYFLYFISVVFDVTIYFAFQNIAYNEQIKGFLEQDQRVLMMFNGSAIIIAIFVAIFISYSSSFFIKKRKKELGLYSLLGLKKKDIAGLLFYENMMIGGLALISGVFIGALLSKLFIMVLLKFIGMQLYIKFAISMQAVIYTAITFGSLFLIISIYVATIIYRFELIELFKADTTTENKERKNSKPSVILAILSILLFVIEGISAMSIVDSPSFYKNVPIVFITSLVGTFIFFGAFLNFAGNKLKKNKKLYYRGDNLISLSHFLYRIKSNTKTLAIIAITNAVALTAITMTYSNHYNMQQIFKLTYPFSYSYVTTGEELDRQVEKIISEHPQNELMGSAEVELIKVAGQQEGKRVAEDLNFETTYLISETMYQEVLKTKGQKVNFASPSESEAILLKYGSKDLDEIKGTKVAIKSSNLSNTLTIKDRKLEEPLNAMGIGPILLVQDDIYKAYSNKEAVVTLKGYSVKNALDSTALSKALVSIMPDDAQFVYVQDFRGVLILTAMLLFIGILIGLIFLTSTGSILYFKQLTEATDDKARYVVLKKIGISKKEIKKSIQKQVIIIFALPIVIALFHNLLALALLGSLVDLSIQVPVIISILAYIFIYGIYYFITVNTYTKIVTEN